MGISPYTGGRSSTLAGAAELYRPEPAEIDNEDRSDSLHHFCLQVEDPDVLRPHGRVTIAEGASRVVCTGPGISVRPSGTRVVSEPARLAMSPLD